MSKSLLTDLYELTMLAGYQREAMHDKPAAFEMYFREMPYQGGYAVFAGLPVILGALADYLAFGEQHLGWIASANLAGATASSILCTFVVTRINRRMLIFVGLVISIGGHLMACMTTEFVPTLIVWAVAGIGQGLCWAIALASLSGSSHAGRNFSYLFVALVVMIGAELFFLPKLAALWGIESDYGQIKGEFFLPHAMANLICANRKKKLFTRQLIAGLKLVESGDVRYDDLYSSWASAFGQTQFIPETYRRLAVDFDRDGRRDLVVLSIRHFGFSSCHFSPLLYQPPPPADRGQA